MSRVRSRLVGDPQPDLQGGIGTAVMGKANAQVDLVPTTGLTEETLLSYDLPAGSLISNLNCIEIHAAYSTEATANTKTGRLKVGGNTILTVTGAHNAEFVLMIARLYRLTSGTFEGYAYGLIDGILPVGAGPSGSITWASLQSIILTGETPTAIGDMSGRQLSALFIP